MVLVRLCGYRGPSVWYFAYGGNLDPSVLERRSIKPLSQRAHVLLDQQLKFAHQSIKTEGEGFATLRPEAGAATYGILYELSHIDSLRLDIFEAVPLGRYRREYFTGKVGRFYAYVSMDVREGLKPKRDYLEKILRLYSGVEGFPGETMEALKRTPVLEEPFRDACVIRPGEKYLPAGAATPAKIWHQLKVVLLKSNVKRFYQ